MLYTQNARSILEVCLHMTPTSPCGQIACANGDWLLKGRMEPEPILPVIKVPVVITIDTV